MRIRASLYSIGVLITVAVCATDAPTVPADKAAPPGAVSGGVISAYTPPPASAPTLIGVDWAGVTVGASYAKRFVECDAHDTCDGASVKYRCSKDPNRNSAIMRLRNDTLFFDAKLALDADGSPYAISNAASINQPDTSLRYPLPGSPSINADRVPFIVIPLGRFARDLGIQLGDVAAVISGSKRVYAIVADEGSQCKIGEGSIALHEALGHKVCLKRASTGDCTQLADSSIDENVLFFIFPRTHERLRAELSADTINQKIEQIGDEAWRGFTSQ